MHSTIEMQAVQAYLLTRLLSCNTKALRALVVISENVRRTLLNDMRVRPFLWPYPPILQTILQLTPSRRGLSRKRCGFPTELLLQEWLRTQPNRLEQLHGT